MFPYSWFSSAVAFSIAPIHLLGIGYVFLAFNFRPSFNPRRSYLREWYHYNCLFQIFLALILLPDILISLLSGWHYAVCSSGSLYTGGLSGSAMFLWTVSKVVDLFETMLLLVEGRRPLKIHIFHHFLSLSYAFTFYSLGFAIHRWIVFFNLCAHVILYSYLSGAKLFQSWTPCWVAVAASQMLQLILPLFVTLSVAAKMARGRQCDANAPGIFVIQIGLAVLILIFSEFYWTRLQVYRQRNLQNKKDEDELTEPTRTPQTTAPMRRRPTDETVIFEKDFPDLRSVIFSP